MTVDQRLILRLEEVSKAVDRDQLLAALHLLDQILKEVGHRPGSVAGSYRKGAPVAGLPSAAPTPPTRTVAAG